MKKIKMILVSAFLLFASENILPAKASAQVSVSFQVFYDDLAPYGNWVSYPGYGYAWAPRYGGFRPYVTGGHWVFTDLGWAWVSDYDWGWAPFHYGSWVDDPAYGWLWVPGYEWAPAWVVWGSYGDYYGWAPVAPGFSISIGYHPPIDYWCFSHPRYIAAGNFGNNYYVATGGRISIGSNTPITTVNNITVINNTNNYSGQQFNAGPPRQDFERAAKTTVQPVAIKENTRPGKTAVSGNAVEMYRPKVNASDKSAAKPANVTPIENIKSNRGNATTPSKAPANNAIKQTPNQQAQPDNNKNMNRTPAGKSNPREVTPPSERKQAPSQPQERKVSPSERQVIPRERGQQQSQPQQQRVSPPERPVVPHERGQQQSQPQQQRVSPPEKQPAPRPENQPPQRAPRQMAPREHRQLNQQPPEMRQPQGIPPSPPHPEPSEKREEPKGPHGPK